MRCLLLTFDCLPRRWLGCYGSLDSTTRGFDRLASLATTFENAVSSDVRVRVDAIAGFGLRGDREHPSLKALGDSLPINTGVFTASDEPPAPSKKRKRPHSHLAQKLHQACDWMREQSGQSLAWVRHAGVSLSDRLTATTDDTDIIVAQLADIDDEVDAFLDEWLDCADERWTLVVTAGRGLLRPRESIQRRETVAARLRFSDDLIRVPLLVLEARGDGFGRRHLPLMPTILVAQAVQEGAAANDHRLATRLRDGATESVRVQGDDGIAIRTADWLWVPSTSADREAGDGHLFRKPEDVCDVFDVRSTHADVALRLEELASA